MLEAKIKKSIAGFKLDVEFKTCNQVVALFGPSGSGKSMTLQCIAGLLRPDEGSIILNRRVLYDGEFQINLLPRERKIGFVFQNYALFPHLTVAGNIAFGIRNLPKNEQSERVASLIERVKLKGLEKRYPHQLSGGQQQRVAMARALAIEPEVLLLDEPFSALDSNVKDELEREILEMQQYYKGDVLLITHNLAEAYKLSSKIAVYQAGRIVQYESKEEIVINPANRKVAALTGMKNFIEGQIEQMMDDKVMVKTTLGVNLVAGNKRRLDKGKKVTLGIRPDFISVSNKPGENMLKCAIMSIVEGISVYLCEFGPSCGARSECCFHVEVPKINAPLFELGQEYYLYFPPESISLITD